MVTESVRSSVDIVARPEPARRGTAANKQTTGKKIMTTQSQTLEMGGEFIEDAVEKTQKQKTEEISHERSEKARLIGILRKRGQKMSVQTSGENEEGLGKHGGPRSSPPKKVVRKKAPVDEQRTIKKREWSRAFANELWRKTRKSIGSRKKSRAKRGNQGAANLKIYV